MLDDPSTRVHLRDPGPAGPTRSIEHGDMTVRLPPRGDGAPDRNPWQALHGRVLRSIAPHGAPSEVTPALPGGSSVQATSSEPEPPSGTSTGWLALRPGSDTARTRSPPLVRSVCPIWPSRMRPSESQTATGEPPAQPSRVVESGHWLRSQESRERRSNFNAPAPAVSNCMPRCDFPAAPRTSTQPDPSGPIPASRAQIHFAI